MLSHEFLKKGHQVKVICFEQDNGVPCGVETYYSPSLGKQLQLFMWSSVFYMPNISLKGIWLLLFNPFKKWVVSHNAWYGPNNVNAKKGFNEKFKLFLLKFARNISVSKAIARYIPVPSVVVPNCYDANIFRHYEHSRTNDILFVGRLVSDKGIDVLMNACLLLWNKGADFKLHIVGKGEMEDWIIDTINKNGLEEKVLLKGKMIGTMLAKEMNAHKIMVVPSTWQEPFGIVALEGLACGCKVICSSGGGLPEAVGEFGDLFINGNVDELASLIETNLNRAYRPNKEQLAVFLATHSPSSVADKYITVFES